MTSGFDARFGSLCGLNHLESFRRSDVLLPLVIRFTKAVTEEG